MDLHTILQYCLTKPGAYEDHPFGPEPTVIKTASKMFALISQKAGKTSLSLKCDPFLAQNLRQQYTAVTPGYHLNKEHWNTVLLDGSVPAAELYWMIDHSHALIIKSLTKAEKASLNI